MLVVIQLAIALVLLVSAGLMIRTFESMRTAEPGFTEPEQLQIFRIFVAGSVRRGPGANDANAERHPGRAGGDSRRDLRRVRQRDADGRVRLEPGRRELGRRRHERRAGCGGENPPLRLFKYASPGFFATAGTRLVAGREITWPEVYGLRPVVTVSENLARELWGTPTAALGKQLRVSPGNAVARGDRRRAGRA